MIKINPLAQEHLQQFINRVELSDHYKLADFAAAITTASGENLQRVLKCTNVEERLQIALELLTEERELAKLQREISKSVEDRMNKQQREYFLKEQLRTIKNVRLISFFSFFSFFHFFLGIFQNFLLTFSIFSIVF